MKPFLPFVCLVNLCLLTDFVSAKPLLHQNGLEPKKELELKREVIREDSLSMNVNLFQGQDKFTLHLSLENFLEGKISIELISEDGSIVFYKSSLSEKTFRRTIHVYNLPVGTYKIEVRNKKQMYSKRIVIALAKGKRSCLLE